MTGTSIICSIACSVYNNEKIPLSRITGNQWVENVGDLAKMQWYGKRLHATMSSSGLILGLRLASERRRYKVTPSLIGCAQT